MLIVRISAVLQANILPELPSLRNRNLTKYTEKEKN